MSARSNRFGMVAALLFAALLVVPTCSFAAEIPALQIEVGVDGSTMLLSPGGSDNGDGTFDFDGAMTANPDWDLEWDITGDPDPFISAVLGLTNVSGVTQTFVLNVSLPIAPPLLPGSFVGGSIGIAVLDANGDGVGTVATASPTAIYNGTLDGSSALSLFSDPYSLSVPFAFGVASDSTDAGLPAFLPGPAATSTIGISHKFTLTPGDSVSFTSFFRAVDSDDGPIVPEPGTLALCSLSLLAAGAFGRRGRTRRTR